MMANPNRDLYSQLSEFVTISGIPLTPAEIQGLWVGLLSSGAKTLPQIALQELLSESRWDLDFETESNINRMFESIRSSLIGEDFSFELILPDDDKPLVERAEQLAAWCQGFLFGMGLAGNQNDTEHHREILKDIQSISQVDTQAEGEEDEAAFAELVEYLRVAAQLIFTQTQLELQKQERRANGI